MTICHFDKGNDTYDNTKRDRCGGVEVHCMSKIIKVVETSYIVDKCMKNQNNSMRKKAPEQLDMEYFLSRY